MNYEGRICRSPMERASFMLPVSVGCSYNQCRFCMLFRHLKYRQLPPEEIKAEIDRVAGLGGSPRRVFLGDGNAFSLSSQQLETVLTWLREAFPKCESVSMDATVHNILSKSDDQLRSLRSLGLTDLYMGIECAQDDVLTLMNKGHTVAQAEGAIEKLHRCGIEYDAHIMTGICGKGRGEENGRELAKFFNRTRPVRICNFSLFLHKGSQLYRLVEDGLFAPADERENLLEELTMLRGLEGVNAEYDGLHDFVPLRVRGTLPGGRDKMIAALEAAIEKYDECPELIPCGIVD